VEFCIVVGVFLSFALYLPRAAHVRLTPFSTTADEHIRERLPQDLQGEPVLCCGLEGELFFGAEPELERHLAAIEEALGADEARVLVLVLERARNPDAAFLSLLRAFHGRMQQRGLALFLCGVQPDLKRALASTGLTAAIGGGRICYE
jgi:SulP family sulfate permease